MSPAKSNETLRKVTLNLFDSDVEDMGHLYGHGWSTAVRDLVHQHVKDRRLIRQTAKVNLEKFES